LRILGIGGIHHDSNAALIEDGKVIAIREEERFTRVKKQAGYPKFAIESCLRESNIILSDVDAIAVGSFSFNQGQFAGELQNLLGAELKVPDIAEKLVYVPHYFAHIASAAFLSPYQKCAVLLVEGGGDYLATALALVNESDIEVCKVFRLRSSLGYLWLMVCDYLGYRPNYDEGKVMALASYGEPKYLDTFLKIAPVEENGDFEIAIYDSNPLGNLRAIELFRQLGIPPRERKFEDYPTKQHCDLAASIQAYTEMVAVRLVNQLYDFEKRYGRDCEGLCVVGGVGLNSSMNGTILTSGPYKNAFLLPMMGDNGTGVGAALFAYHYIFGHKRATPVRFSPYTGESYSEKQVDQAISRSNIPSVVPHDLLDQVARLLAEGRILGWFQGRSECGPRALGNRSILADPRRPDIKDRLNARVKHREMYRPYAPSVLAEKAGEFFDLHGEAPFMVQVVNVLEDKKRLVPAITHVDGTARVQTVRREDNPVFYDLIVAFERITKVPLVLNTSFNVAGEPIVETPEDALKCFQSTDLDALILGKRLVRKSGV
jgi:carbamoyltransferase